MTPKVLIIGLDGATWNLMKPLTEKGRLRTFRKNQEIKEEEKIN